MSVGVTVAVLCVAVVFAATQKQVHVDAALPD